MARSISEYYAELGELDRLQLTSWGRLEYLRTREIIEHVLPAAACTVLDVGGGTGIHAEWLAAAGHRVHVVDPEPSHVEHAARLPGVTASVGDARALDRPDDGADAVLLLGPLYHLPDRADRLRALSEAARVARPGGVVVAAVIARHASLLDVASRGLLTEELMASIRESIRTGVHDPAIGFTTAYFHTGEQIAGEFVDAGLTDVTVHGVEGPGYMVLKVADGTELLTDALVDSVLRLARETERDEALLEAGSHLLAVGRV